ncbi:MAG: hypothetical protein RL721_305 [Candidatus Eisenbacteria bacterium]|jgi:DNA polymerase III subunit delta'
MLEVNLSGLLGQPEVSAFLRGIVGRGRYGNAYLFHGPPGVGKCTAALAFARAALCERVSGGRPSDEGASLFGAAEPEPVAATGDDACGTCRGCRMSLALGHPDLPFVFPLEGDEKEQEEDLTETLEGLRKDPLYVFQYERAASIRIRQTRELIAQLGYRPHNAARRVVVVRDCDRMREDQFSALLKSIEEPGEATVWVLTTSRLSRVPVTIRSRCQRVRFAALSEDTVRRVLVEQAGVAEAEASLLAALANGSLGRALVMRDATPPMAEQRDRAITLLKSVLDGQPAALWQGVQAYTAFGKAKRDELRLMMEFHQLWLRDLLRLRYGGDEAGIVNRDRLPQLRALAPAIEASEVRRRLMVIEEALRSIEGNVSADLTLFSTLARVAGSRMGEGRWPAHTTGRWDL